MAREILRYAAFTDTPDGGNPAGVVLEADGMDDAEMLAIAAEIGFSETAFASRPVGDRVPVRYFSPKAEVPFCGHATIATVVALAARVAPDAALSLIFETAPGPVAIEVDGASGRPVATLTSVSPTVLPAEPADVAEALAALRWSSEDLDPALPPRIGFAGAHHLILAARSRERLADLNYDFDRLGALMAARDWTTVDLVWREDATTFRARNPFPPGGIVEDPATGAAAAAFGAYLRVLDAIDVPARLTIHQGDDINRPSVLSVAVPAGTGGIAVSGSAVLIPT